MATITEEQYLLASRANISIEESNCLPDFEKDALLNLVLRDEVERQKILESPSRR